MTNIPDPMDPDCLYKAYNRDCDWLDEDEEEEEGMELEDPLASFGSHHQGTHKGFIM